MLAYEAGTYVWHRSMHSSNALWRIFHQMHHSAERIDSFGALLGKRDGSLSSFGVTTRGKIMSKYRNRLPQSHDAIFITDGGLETTLIYHQGIELPAFAAFDLLKNEAGLRVLRNYYVRYAELARAHRMGLVLESPTWRANADWGRTLGYDELALADANRKAIGLMLEIRAELATATTRMVISGNLGPRGDGYSPGMRMSAEQARTYHAPQIETFAATDADMVCALTMNYVEEAIGIALAAKACAIPVALSFTLETDGRVPSGTRCHRRLRKPIARRAATPRTT